MKWFSLKIKRKLMTGLSVFWVCAGMAVQTVGEPSISLSLRKGTLKELFVAIENKSDYKFVYDSSEIDTGRSISAVYSNQDISTILSETLDGLSYEIKGNQIIIRKSDAQEKRPQPESPCRAKSPMRTAKRLSAPTFWKKAPGPEASPMQTETSHCR